MLKTAMPLLVLASAYAAPAAAAELVSNGNFEAGNSGFSSTYRYSSGPTGSDQGAPTYALATSPALAANSYPGWKNYGDHTTGAGLMFVADGGAGTAWSQAIQLVAGQNYKYSFWGHEILDNSRSPSELEFLVGNVVIGTALTLGTDGWQQSIGDFTASTGGLYTLSIRDRNVGSPYNDFALDDISFSSSSVPEASTWAMLLVGFGGTGLALRRSRRRTGFA